PPRCITQLLGGHQLLGGLMQLMLVCGAKLLHQLVFPVVQFLQLFDQTTQLCKRILELGGKSLVAGLLERGVDSLDKFHDLYLRLVPLVWPATVAAKYSASNAGLSALSASASV